MNGSNQAITSKVMLRLMISGVGLLLSLLLSATAFYYFFAKAPLIPLLVGLTGVIPMGIMVDEVRRLLKLKKPQQPHHPPHRS